jgi:hypothetical protein
LARFKKGWANEERIAWLCGKIINKSAYKDLSNKVKNTSNFFPAYRSSL